MTLILASLAWLLIGFIEGAKNHDQGALTCFATASILGGIAFSVRR